MTSEALSAYQQVTPLTAEVVKKESGETPVASPIPCDEEAMRIEMSHSEKEHGHWENFTYFPDPLTPTTV